MQLAGAHPVIHATWNARRHALRLLRPASLALLLLASSTLAAQEPSLLGRALSCGISDAEVTTLIADLRAGTAGMKMPAALLAAPTGNVYRLDAPVSAFGLSSTTILVQPARILMAIPHTTLSAVSKDLRLDAVPFSPSSRDIRPSVSVIAFELHQKELEGQVLVGCQYAQPAAAGWIDTP